LTGRRPVGHGLWRVISFAAWARVFGIQGVAP
jgi:hypothetical protein